MVPWLLLSEADMPHIGTGDVDLVLDPSELGDGEYVRPVEALQENGYQQRDNLRRFRLVRTVTARDGGTDIDVVVDFPMPRDAEIMRDRPPLISQFAVRRAHGTDLALRLYQMSQSMEPCLMEVEIGCVSPLHRSRSSWP